MSVKLSSVLKPMREKSHSSYLHWLTAEGFSVSCLYLTGCHGEPYAENVIKDFGKQKKDSTWFLYNPSESCTHTGETL